MYDFYIINNILNHLLSLNIFDQEIKIAKCKCYNSANEISVKSMHYNNRNILKIISILFLITFLF